MGKTGRALLGVALLVVMVLAGCGGASEAGDGDAVKVHYTGTLEDGTEFDTSRDREPLEFTLGEGKLIPGFEEAVLGMQVGESKVVTIPADQAYGPYRDDLVSIVQRDELPEDFEPEVGQRLQAQQSDGQTVFVSVVEVSENSITVDANHPLAGKDLTFEIELLQIE